MSNFVSMSRRSFAIGALNMSALGAFSSISFPLNAAEQTVIWNGVHFIQNASNERDNMKKFFLHI